MRARKPFWPKTLRVDPVHLQASDAYREQLRTRALRRALPDAYGIVDMEYDDGALAHGQLVFRKLEVLFPSGIEASLEAPLEADVQTRLYGLTSSISVYLGVPKLLRKGPNMSPEGKGARRTRYVGKLDEPSPWMRANLEILFDDDPKERYELVGAGRLERVGASIQFSRSGWPTVVHARACKPLLTSVGQVMEALEHRRKELLGERRLHPFHLTSIGTFPEDALDLMVIIGRNLAALRVMLAKRATVPYAYYERLVALYLSLAGFEDDIEEPPRYEHEAQGKSFPWLSARIIELVRRVARAPITQLPFTRTDGHSFSLSFRREDLAKKRAVLVAICPDEAFLEQHLRRLIKMAPPFAIAELMHGASSGVRLELDIDPPLELPRGRGIAAYRILRDRHHLQARPYWQDILTCGEAHIYLPHAPANLQLFLYGVPWDA